MSLLALKVFRILFYSGVLGVVFLASGCVSTAITQGLYSVDDVDHEVSPDHAPFENDRVGLNAYKHHREHLLRLEQGPMLNLYPAQARPISGGELDCSLGSQQVRYPIFNLETTHPAPAEDRNKVGQFLIPARSSIFVSSATAICLACLPGFSEAVCDVR